MPATNTTQAFVDIKDVKENVIIQKNGQMCTILLASSINFALKSLEEQQAVLKQFQNFLNTIDFTLQIYIQSRRLNIQPYVELLEGMHETQNNDLMRTQLTEYIDFIKSFTEGVDVMSKNFFVVIPYSPTPTNLSKGITKLFDTKPKKISTADSNFTEHKLQLEQRIGIVSDGLARVGVRTITLQKDDLVELFYHIYNPADSTGSAPHVESI